MVAVGRKKDRVQLPEKPDLKEVAYTFERVDRPVRYKVGPCRKRGARPVRPYFLSTTSRN